MTSEQLAQRFHELYEELAPAYGYETRKESAVAWEHVPAKNRKLMMAVCVRILDELTARKMEAAIIRAFVERMQERAKAFNPDVAFAIWGALQDELAAMEGENEPSS